MGQQRDGDVLPGAERAGPWRLASHFVGLIVLALAYIAAGKFGLSLATVHASATPVWIPTGLAIAAFVVWGLGVWPAIAAGALVVNFSTTNDLPSSFGIALGNTVEGAAAGFLVRRFARGSAVFASPSGVFAYTAFAAVLAPLLSAGIGIGSLVLAGLLPLGQLLPVFSTWWIGDAVGALVVGPLLICLAYDRSFAWRSGAALELMAIALAVLGIAMLIFLPLLPSELRGLPLEHLCLAPVLWAALRFDQRIVAGTVIAVAAIAIWGTVLGEGPFAGSGPNQSLVLLQVFVAMLAITGMTTAAVAAQRRRLQEELAIRAQRLARSNEELEQFAAVASHDLQAPLRRITSYVDVLRARHADRFDAEAERWLAEIGEGAAAMSGLVRSLLESARAGGRIEIGDVDLNRVLDEVLADLQDQIRELGAVIERESLTMVRADPRQLRLLLQNLIDNALKFHGDRPPLIRVACERRRRSWLICVRDNGIGVAAEHRERIFDMFRRVDGGERYPGSGIGLATCRKIVERHGGRIWIESEYGQGAAVFFALPDQLAGG